ncbi:tryptophan-rich sensory protein [Cellulomonas sp. URHB0016]
MVTTTASVDREPVTADRVRQVSVLVGAVVAIAGAAVGSGAFGGQAIADAAGGALSADATPMAPAGPAFAIWSVIYLGLAVVAVGQALPGQGSNPRQRATGWWVLASMLLNAVWIGVVQAGWLLGSVLVILALLAVLCVVYVALVARPPRGPVDVALDVTLGLYLGWVSVAALANIAAVLADAGVGELGLGATGWSTVLLVAAAVLALAYAVRGRLRPTVIVPVGMAMSWGLAWISIGRAEGPLHDGTVAAVAALASGVALVGSVVAAVVGRRRA